MESGRWIGRGDGNVSALFFCYKLFGSGFCAWKARFQEFYLSVMIGFVFGYVKPFGVIVGFEVALDCHGDQPFVVALFEFGESFLANLMQLGEVEVEAVAFDART